MIRLLLVDDQELVRREIREKLEETKRVRVVGETATSKASLNKLPLGDVDVALLDVALPDGNGVYLCRELRSKRPDLACLLLTSYANDEALDAAVLAGAQGFVMKDMSGNEFIEALHRVANGETLLTDDMINRSRLRLALRVEEDARLASLSVQEHRILALLSDGLTNREIAESLHLAEKTVKNYLANLLVKLGFHRRTEAALFAQRRSTPDTA
jgi:DNA-binding NarL/FixJ family response regulator